jgi:hypothetical protein
MVPKTRVGMCVAKKPTYGVTGRQIIMRTNLIIPFFCSFFYYSGFFHMFVWRLPDGRVNRNDEKHITGGIKSISKNIERDAKWEIFDMQHKAT